MSKKFEEIQKEDTETVIGAGVDVEGTFKANGNVTIKGHISGSVETQADLYIAETAHIEGDTTAKNVLVGGEMHGNIVADDKVKLLGSAKIIGDVTCQFLSIEEGARLNGKCQMGKKENAA